MTIFDNKQTEDTKVQQPQQPNRQQLSLDQIPDNRKKQLSCSNCGCKVFYKHYNIWKLTDEDGNVGYGHVEQVLCCACNKQLEARP